MSDRSVETALASVMAQTITPLEIVVVDDHSTDDGPVRAARFPGVRVYRAQGRGAPAARQQALGLVRGQRIAFLDQDDVWAPDHLASLAAALDRHPEAAFVWSRMKSWSGDPKVLQRLLIGGLPERWLDPWVTLPSCEIPTPSCVMVERDRLQAVGGWNPDLAVADLHTYLRLTCHGRALQTARTSVAYRQSPDSYSRRLRRDPAALLASQVESVRSALQWREAHGPRDPAARARLAVMERMLDLLTDDPVQLAQYVALHAASDCSADSVISHLQYLCPGARDPGVVISQLQRLQNCPQARALQLSMARLLRATSLLQHGWHRPRLWPILASSILDRVRVRFFPN